jgi:outer membrane protein TolC
LLKLYCTVRNKGDILIRLCTCSVEIKCFAWPTTSSRKSRARAKLEAILAKVKLAEEEAALYKRKAIIRQQTDEEQINADLNVLRIKREAVDAEVEVRVADEDAKNVPHGLNILSR